MTASHGGNLNASAAISSWCSASLPDAAMTASSRACSAASASKSASGSATRRTLHRVFLGGEHFAQTFFHGRHVFGVELRSLVADLDVRQVLYLAVVFLSTPAMMRSTVDLPEPFRPSRPIWRRGRS
jgi:hypothetical protein